MTLATIRANALRSLIPPPRLRLSEWSGVLRTVRAGMLAVPSRAAQRSGCRIYRRMMLPRSTRRFGRRWSN
jgi:hypothetical protein